MKSSEDISKSTKILVKDAAFGSTPISRSQAKRLCDGLEKFEEIILDFSDIAWMGQGFAHQIFVVFANANPEIVINPINMNENVTKMYNHVKLSNV